MRQVQFQIFYECPVHPCGEPELPPVTRVSFISLPLSNHITTVLTNVNRKVRLIDGSYTIQTNQIKFTFNF